MASAWPKFLSAGTASAARMAMMLSTTSISTRVKAVERRVMIDEGIDDAATRTFRLRLSYIVNRQSSIIVHCQLKMLSLLTPGLAVMVGSTFPSGPADQTITLPWNRKLSRPAIGINQTI